MALNSGKILMRRGQEVNFDPNKMTPGEWAVSLDNKYVRMCFSPGVCVRMATYDAFEADMVQIQRILSECQAIEEVVTRINEEIKDVVVDVERVEIAASSALQSEENALNSANSAMQSAETATNKAEEALNSANIATEKAAESTLGAETATQKAEEALQSSENVRNMSDVSQSYAVGGTGTREGEDTDNSKYYNQQASDNADRAEAAAERASSVADVGVATTEKAGLVKPDGETIRVDLDGTIHADRGTTSYTDLENKPKINNVVLEGKKTLEELGIASKEALEKTDNKVNIIIEHAELRFKETASGENIHLDDSVDSKLVEFGLYGKAVHSGDPTPEAPIDIEVSGESYNLLENTATSQTVNSVVFTVNEDKSISITGKATEWTDYKVNSSFTLKKGEYIASCGGTHQNPSFRIIRRSDLKELYTSKSGNIGSFGLEEDAEIFAQISVSNTAEQPNCTFYPMIRKASVKNTRYIPYGIDNVEVVSCGKNLIPYPFYHTTRTVGGVTFTDNGDGTVTVNGTATENAVFRVYEFNGNEIFVGKKYILSGCPIGGSHDKYHLGTYRSETVDGSGGSKSEYGSGVEGTWLNDGSGVKSHIYISVISGTTVNNLTFKPMLRLASDTDSTYEPYKSKTATIPTENGLAGIPVDNGGNYTDSNGQQWICDEVVKYADGSGEKIQRVGIVDSYSAETITGVYMSTTGELTEGAKILYQLAKPITTSLTAEELAEIEKLSTFYPVTNISNDFDCGMKVKYIADAKSYIDNRLALIEQAMLNSI